MAKIVYSSLVAGIAGRMDDIVYYRSRNQYFGYIREYSYPRITPNNHRFGLKMQNVGKIWSETTAGFKKDMEKYMYHYRNLPPDLKSLTEKANNSTAIFVMAMYEFEKRNHEHIGLESITLVDIFDLYPEMRSVSEMVKNGILPRLPGWQELDSPIYSDVVSG